MAGREYRDSYQLFSSGGLDFIIVNLEINPPSSVVTWANGLLTTYASRRAIVVTHDYLTGRGPVRRWATSLWTNLVSGNCNVFMVLSGHATEEASSPTRGGSCQPVHQVLQDYQSRANGGDGWLRYFTFKPSQNKIYAFTWKVPQGATAGQFETDANSQFSLDYNMSGAGAWQVIGTATAVHWAAMRRSRGTASPTRQRTSGTPRSVTAHSRRPARPGRSRPPRRLDLHPERHRERSAGGAPLVGPASAFDAATNA